MSEVETKPVTPQRVDSSATLSVQALCQAGGFCSSSPCPTFVDGESNTSDCTKGENLTRPSMTERATTSSSHVRSQMSGLRKGLLLLLFVMAQFLDVFNNSALFPALPLIGDSFDLNSSESQWVYRLVFALVFSLDVLIRCSQRILPDVLKLPTSFRPDR